MGNLRVGLRFRKSQKAVLTNIADRMDSEGIGSEHTSLFRSAAEAARTGEPLIVVCDDPTEAILMAAAFPKWGVAAPTVEELSPVAGTPGG